MTKFSIKFKIPYFWALLFPNLDKNEFSKNVDPSLFSIYDDGDVLFFEGWLTYEQQSSVFPEGTIVRKPHHRDFPTWRGGNQS